MSKKKGKNCKKSYPCGASCISLRYACRKSFTEGVSVSIDGTRKVIMNNIDKDKESLPTPTPTPAPAPVPAPTPESEPTTRAISEPTPPPIVKDIEPKDEPITNNSTFLELNTDANFNSDGMDRLGKGAYGSAYLTKDIPPKVLKTGELGEYEVEGLKVLGDLGIGPKVSAAKYNDDGKDRYDPFYKVNTKKGSIIMDRVEGKRLGKTKITEKELIDVLKARGKLHKAGFSHNDMHAFNIIKGKDGSINFIDMGVAQKNTTSAFLEGMGATLKLNSVARMSKDHNKFQAKYNKAKNKIVDEMILDGVPKKLAKTVTNRVARDHEKVVKEWKDKYNWDANSPENVAKLKKFTKRLYEEVDKM